MRRTIVAALLAQLVLLLGTGVGYTDTTGEERIGKLYRKRAPYATASPTGVTGPDPGPSPGPYCFGFVYPPSFGSYYAPRGGTPGVKWWRIAAVTITKCNMVEQPWISTHHRVCIDRGQWSPGADRLVAFKLICRGKTVLYPHPINKQTVGWRCYRPYREDWFRNRTDVEYRLPQLFLDTQVSSWQRLPC